MLAVENGGRQHLKSIGGIFIAQFADMVSYAKYLLHEHKPTATFTHGLGVVNRDFRAIRHRHANHFAHCTLPYDILNLSSKNVLRQFVILKQVQDDD
jgi:hypothetical protein